MDRPVPVLLDSRPMSLLQDIRALPRLAWILFIGSFVNRVGGFVIVFLVLFLTRKGYSVQEAGMTVAAYGAGGVFSAIAGGYLADHIGRRNTIVLSMLSAAATMMLLPFAEGRWTIILTTIAVGFTAEMYRPAASALLADITEPAQRVTAYAVYRLAINLGWAVGPALGGILAGMNFLYVFVADAATCVGFAIIAAFMLPNTVDDGHHEEVPRRGSLRVILADGRFLVFILMSMIGALIVTQMSSTYPLQVQLHGLSDVAYGALISVNGIVILALELWVSTLTRVRDARVSMGVGMLLLGGGFGLTGFVSSIPLLVATVVVWTFGEMIFMPVAAAWVNNAAPRDMRGRYNGAWVMSWAVGSILGPSLGTAMFAINPMIVWIGCLVLGAASASLAVFVRSTSS